MLQHVLTFARSEDGAVTVDWVVLTAAVVGLGMAAIVSISGASGTVGTVVSEWLSAFTVG